MWYILPVFNELIACSGLYSNELLCLEEYEDEAAFMRHLDSERVQTFLKLDTIENADVAPYFIRK
jgi:quinol monooxygenase YgiN